MIERVLFAGEVVCGDGRKFVFDNSLGKMEDLREMIEVGMMLRQDSDSILQQGEQAFLDRFAPFLARMTREYAIPALIVVLYLL